MAVWRKIAKGEGLFAENCSASTEGDDGRGFAEETWYGRVVASKRWTRGAFGDGVQKMWVVDVGIEMD